MNIIDIRPTQVKKKRHRKIKQKYFEINYYTRTHTHTHKSTNPIPPMTYVNGLTNLMATGKLIELNARNTWINSI